MIAIALEAGDPALVAFEHPARGVLGPEATLRIDTAASDPPDAEVAVLGANADGVVELTLSEDGAHARLHCYLPGQKRWIDRDIVFGTDGAPSESEATERGRLLGFAAATMFTGEENTPEARQDAAAAPAPVAPPVVSAGVGEASPSY